MLKRYGLFSLWKSKEKQIIWYLLQSISGFSLSGLHKWQNVSSNFTVLVLVLMSYNIIVDRIFQELSRIIAILNAFSFYVGSSAGSVSKIVLQTSKTNHCILLLLWLCQAFCLSELILYKFKGNTSHTAEAGVIEENNRDVASLNLQQCDWNTTFI